MRMHIQSLCVQFIDLQIKRKQNSLSDYMNSHWYFQSIEIIWMHCIGCMRIEICFFSAFYYYVFKPTLQLLRKWKWNFRFFNKICFWIDKIVDITLFLALCMYFQYQVWFNTFRLLTLPRLFHDSPIISQENNREKDFTLIFHLTNVCQLWNIFFFQKNKIYFHFHFDAY